MGASRRVARVSAGLLTAFALTISNAAAAAEGPCEDPRLEVQKPLGAPWEDALRATCKDLPRGADGDPEAHVKVRELGNELVLEVRLADGREAVRLVKSPEALPQTLDAVLRLPVLAPKPPTPPEPKPAAEKTTPPAPEPPRTRDLPRAETLGIDAGAILGGRVGGSEPYISLSPTLFGQIRVRGFSIGLSVRWEVIQKSANSHKPEMNTLAAGLVFGRRIGTAPFAVDLGLSPRIAVVTQTTGRRADEVDHSVADLRVAAFGRAYFGSGQLRFVVETDVELSPADLQNDRRLDANLPLLPSWGLGLSVGAAWSDP
jgi:hypothetical protein